MRTFFIFYFAFYLLACQNTSPKTEDRKDGYTAVLKTKEDSLFHEVMQGHDIGMARMGKVRGYLKQIQSELDSLARIPGNKLDENYQEALIDLQEDLNYADYSMYTWMDEFEADSAKTDKAKRLAYLESEKIKVEKVKENILSGLQRADSLLKK